MDNCKKKRKIDNFEEYLKFKGITENRATKECNLAQGLLGNARKKEVYDLGYVSVDRILKTYKDLSPKFLIHGEGPMIIEVQEDKEDKENHPNLCSHTDEEFEILTKKITELTSELNVCNKEINLLKGTIEFMKNLVKGNGQS